jgi:hypothetical protein
MKMTQPQDSHRFFREPKCYGMYAVRARKQKKGPIYEKVILYTDPSTPQDFGRVQSSASFPGLYRV